MSTVEFRLMPPNPDLPGGPTIEVFIDGARLQGLVRAAEQSYIDADPDLAGFTSDDLTSA